MYNEVYYLYTTKVPPKNQGWNGGHFTPSTSAMLVTSQKWYNGISVLANISIQQLANVLLAAHFNQAICDVCLVYV